MDKQTTQDADAQRGAVRSTAGLGCDLITAERRRQVEQEGWSEEHDNGHTRGELALAAACYAKAAVLGHHNGLVWPWSNEWYKPGPYTKREARIRALVKAGALIAAEIDRMSRLPNRKRSEAS